MYILGISAFYHDSAACLIKDGEILSAAQEERFTRKKHDYNFPQNAIEFCLNDAGITSDQLDLVAFYDKPFLKFERLLETYLTFAPIGIKSFIKAMPLWIKEKLWMKEMIKDKLGYSGKVIFDNVITDSAPASINTKHPDSRTRSRPVTALFTYIVVFRNARSTSYCES